MQSIQFDSGVGKPRGIARIDTGKNQDRTGRIDAIPVSMEFRRTACIYVHENISTTSEEIELRDPYFTRLERTGNVLGFK